MYVPILLPSPLYIPQPAGYCSKPRKAPKISHSLPNAKQPIKYPDTVIVAHKLRQVGESGKFVDLDAIIISQQHQRIAARVSERNFFYSYVEEKAAAAPELVVRAIEKRDENEEWLKERAREEIRELEAWIKEKKN